jgi:para-aminobenzoate synthetase component 1
MSERPVVIARVQGQFDPSGLFDRLPPSQDRFLLESGPTGPEETRRWSFLGSRPFAVFTLHDGETRLKTQDGERLLPGDPFAALDALLSQWRLEHVAGLPPLAGGFVGYFAYDSGRYIERLPATALNESSLPDIYLCAYDALLAIDHSGGEAWVIASPLPGREEAAARLAQELARVVTETVPAREMAPKEAVPEAAIRVRSNFDRAGYSSAVERARDYIRAGDIFEVNLSQRFTAGVPFPARRLHERLRALSPAPFSAYLDAGRFQVVSSSPERFLRVDELRRVETRPIKGTRPRGKGARQDAELARELLASEKDQAELNMIVDLSRNDLGRVCQIGTVRVSAARRLERYANVHHAVAVIEGELMPTATMGDLLRATLPGGSITGAPKIRAMEIIEELEGVRRNAYCGALGYLGFTGQLDLSIMIRTMVCADGRVTFGAGGAVVLDSDPDGEYDETLAKASAMLQALGAEVV